MITDEIFGRFVRARDGGAGLDTKIRLLLEYLFAVHLHVTMLLDDQDKAAVSQAAVSCIRRNLPHVETCRSESWDSLVWLYSEFRNCEKLGVFP